MKVFVKCYGMYIYTLRLTVLNDGALGALLDEDGALLVVLLGLLHLGEGQLLVVELLDEGALAVSVGDALDGHDLDVGEASAVLGGHIVQGLGDGAGLGDVTELLGHGGVTDLLGVVAQIDGVVASGQLLVLDQGAGQDVTTGGLDLVLLAHQAPEAGLGDDVVLGEDLVLVDGGVGGGGGGGLAADDGVVLDEGAHDYCLPSK